MIIRSEQMKTFESAAEDSFVRRLSQHLLERYADAVVTLPDERQMAVQKLPDETLQSLVRGAIKRARRNGLTYESSIAAFTAVMFEVSPNFDTHQLSKMLLNDEEIEPNARIDELLKVLTERNWENIKSNYDANAWESNSEEQTENGE